MEASQVPPDRARAGEILLHKPWQRAVYIGLAAPFILPLLLRVLY
jgi:hypothetical protein